MTKHRRRSPKLGTGITLPWLKAHANYDGEGCLIWPFNKQGRGYGMFGIGGHMFYAHRAMCELVHGPAPSPTHHAAHSCGKGHLGCVHPKHIAWKTPSENYLDKRRHGTTRSGRGPKGKLTVDQVRQIRALEGRMSQDAIAKKFGTCRSNVWMILRGKSRTGGERKPLMANQG